MYNLGLQLKKFRESRGLTQRELGIRINKSTGAICSYETNVQHPPLDVLVSIACVLNVTLDTLVGFDHDECVSMKSLTQEQKDLINALLSEFAKPSYKNGELSYHQIEIIRKMMVIFSENNSE